MTIESRCNVGGLPVRMNVKLAGRELHVRSIYRGASAAVLGNDGRTEGRRAGRGAPYAYAAMATVAAGPMAVIVAIAHERMGNGETRHDECCEMSRDADGRTDLRPSGKSAGVPEFLSRITVTRITVTVHLSNLSPIVT